MKCSKLNFHLFSLHVVDSPACPRGHDCEDSNHYLLQCPLFYQARNRVINEIRELTMTFRMSCYYMDQQNSVLQQVKTFLMLYVSLSTKLVDCNLYFSLVSHTVSLSIRLLLSNILFLKVCARTCVCVIRFLCKYFFWRGLCHVVCRAQSFSSEYNMSRPK